jgi:hypothetical protein
MRKTLKYQHCTRAKSWQVAGSGIIIIIIISPLMSPLLGHRSPLWVTPIGRTTGVLHKRTGHDPPRGQGADWWVLTTANAAGTNGLTCFLKHGGARDKFLVTHLMTDQSCLPSAIARRSALITTPSSSSLVLLII